MRRVQGYAVVTDPDRGVTEYDTLHCGHCQFVMHIRHRAQADELGGFCRMCMRHLCGPCADTGVCEPFEKKLERYERAHRMHQAMGLVLRAVVLAAILMGVTAAEAAPLRVTWTDASTDETRFELERQLGACGVDRHAWAQIAVLAANVTTYDDDGLAEGEVYCYRVRACNAQGCSTYSNAEDERTNRPPKGNEFFMSQCETAVA